MLKRILVFAYVCVTVTQVSAMSQRAVDQQKCDERCSAQFGSDFKGVLMPGACTRSIPPSCSYICRACEKQVPIEDSTGLLTKSRTAAQMNDQKEVNALMDASRATQQQCRTLCKESNLAFTGFATMPSLHCKCQTNDLK